MDAISRQQRAQRRSAARGNDIDPTKLKVINDCAMPSNDHHDDGNSSEDMDTTAGGVPLGNLSQANPQPSAPHPGFQDIYFSENENSDGEPIDRKPSPNSHPSTNRMALVYSSDSDSDAPLPNAPPILDEPPTAASSSTLARKQLNSLTYAFGVSRITPRVKKSRRRKAISDREVRSQPDQPTSALTAMAPDSSVADPSSLIRDHDINNMPTVTRTEHIHSEYDAQKDEKVKSIMAATGWTRLEALKRLDQKGVNKRLRKAAKREMGGLGVKVGRVRKERAKRGRKKKERQVLALVDAMKGDEAVEHIGKGLGAFTLAVR